jgi:hypothetical protein
LAFSSKVVRRSFGRLDAKAERLVGQEMDVGPANRESAHERSPDLSK